MAAEVSIDLKIPTLDALATNLKRLTDALDANDNSTAGVAVRAIQLMRQAGEERDQANTELGAALDQRDGAYRERAQLVALLAAIYTTVIAPAPDIDEPGWHIAYLYISGLQASWHIAPSDIELFAHVKRVEADDPLAKWDGHTTAKKYGRIASLTAELAQRCGSEYDEGHAYAGRCEGAPKKDG